MIANLIDPSTSSSTVMSQSLAHARIEKFSDTILINLLKVLLLLVSVWEQRLLTFTSVESSGMSRCNFSAQLMRHMLRVSLERMPVAVAMTLTSMFNQEQEPTFVERNLLWLRASRESPVDPDWSLHSQPMPASTVAPLPSQMWRQFLSYQPSWEEVPHGLLDSVETRTRVLSCSVSLVT